MTRILNVVTNVGHFAEADHPTGPWLSELTHAWHVFESAGYEQTLVSPAGGAVPLEPRSLKFPYYEATAKAWHSDPDRMALLEHTSSPEDIDAADFDAIYFTGGHAVMYDFTDSPGLQQITREIWERGAARGSRTPTALSRRQHLRFDKVRRPLPRLPGHVIPRRDR